MLEYIALDKSSEYRAVKAEAREALLFTMSNMRRLVSYSIWALSRKSKSILRVLFRARAVFSNSTRISAFTGTAGKERVNRLSFLS